KPLEDFLPSCAGFLEVLPTNRPLLAQPGCLHRTPPLPSLPNAGPVYRTGFATSKSDPSQSDAETLGPNRLTSSRMLSVSAVASTTRGHLVSVRSAFLHRRSRSSSSSRP